MPSFKQQGRTNSIVFSCWKPDLHKEIDFSCSRKYNTSGKLLSNSRTTTNKHHFISGIKVLTYFFFRKTLPEGYNNKAEL